MTPSEVTDPVWKSVDIVHIEEGTNCSCDKISHLLCHAQVKFWKLFKHGLKLSHYRSYFIVIK